MVVDPVDVGRALRAVVEQDPAGIEVEELQTAARPVDTEDSNDPVCASGQARGDVVVSA